MSGIFILALLVGDDKAATEAIEKFKAEYKSKETAAKVKAIEDLTPVQHEKVTARLVALFTAEEKDVRIAAAKALGARTDDKEKKKASLALGSVLKSNEKWPEIQTAILETIAKLGDEAGLPEAHKLIAAETADLAQAAIATAGTIKSRTSFDPLIKRLKEVDELLKPRDPSQPRGGFGGGRLLGGNNSPQNAREMRELARTLQPILKKTLAEMGGIHCEDGKDWELWWKENQAKYKAPPKS